MEEITTLAAALMASLSGGSAYPAPSGENVFLGYYYVLEEVEEESWYYIPGEMRDDFLAMGREVRTHPDYNQQFGFSLRYSSKATPELGKVTGIRPIYASLDSLIFLIGELEAEADKLSQEFSLMTDENGDPVSNPLDTESDIVNAVLGYVRSTNREYQSGYGTQNGYSNFFLDVFGFVCGSTVSEFDSRIAASTRHHFRFPNYFGRLVDENLYNASRCGQVTQTNGLSEHGWKLEIPDPIEPSVSLGRYINGSFVPETVHPNLDIPHMFAGIDAAYEHTGYFDLFNVISFRLPDIASWGGDLQTSYLFNLNLVEPFDNNLECFKNLLSSDGSRFGIDDFVSDVDAINIGESYINYLGKRPSEALASYYSPKAQFSRFRYDQFPGNALEANGIGVNYSQIWSAFESRTYWDMRLEKNGAGELVSVPANLDRNPEHYLIQNDPSSNASKREKFAKCFLEYVKSKSVYGVGSC